MSLETDDNMSVSDIVDLVGLDPSLSLIISHLTLLRGQTS